MRITGGELRGRTLKTPRGERVRPTQDRVREALFSMLMTELPGARFLDLFAGTGAVGIEAKSRGASEVTWVEADRATCRLADENIARIVGGGMRTICAEAHRYIASLGCGAAFDIVFADPPYAMARGDGLRGLADALSATGTLAASGLLITETPSEAPVESWPGWETLRDRRYGHTRIVIRRRTASAADAGACEENPS